MDHHFTEEKSCMNLRKMLNSVIREVKMECVNISHPLDGKIL